MRRVAILLAAIGLALPAAASAAGGPVGAVQGGTGVGLPGRDVRYVAVAVAGHTVVERLVAGEVDWWRALPGRFGVPGAAGDGTLTGLSGDGRTLVLAQLTRRYPPRRTRLVVLGLRPYRAFVRARVTLPGFFTVDAVSPDGRRLYLIHYTHGDDLLRYEVRAYDVARRRLAPTPIVDPREPDEKMLGTPVARVMSADSRWAYTLYVRAKAPPFIHALDTQKGTAACIDLDGVTEAEVTALHLLPPTGGGPLVLASATGRPVKLVNRTTFAVSDPTAPARARTPAKRHAARPPGDAGGGPPWGFAAVLIAGLAVVAVAARRGRAKSAA